MQLFFAQALLPGGWANNVRVEIASGRIVAIAKGVPPKEEDERHSIGVPGLCNLHSHAFQRGMAGLAEVRGPTTDTFWTWREVMYRFALAMTPSDMEAVAAQAYVEMLEGGFTRVGEFHYLHNDEKGAAYANPAEMAERIAAAVQEAGINLTLLPVYYAYSGFGGAPLHAGQRRFATSVDSFSRLLAASRTAVAAIEGAIVGVAPHSLRATTPDDLASVITMSEGGPIHIHAAEQVLEVQECIAWSGARPVEWLLDHSPVDAHWCFIHATHLTEEETRRMAAAGTVAGLCPITEANLGDGFFNGPLFAGLGGAYGIGTDSNVSIGAAEELRQLEYAQRLKHRTRNVMANSEGRSTGRALFDAVSAGGSRALGSPVAGLSIGAFADIVSFNMHHPAMIERAGDSALDAWIFAGGRHALDCVWSRGRRMVTAGRHSNQEAIFDRFRSVMSRLLAL